MAFIKNGVEVRNVRIRDACAYVGCGHSKLYEVMKEFGIKPKRIGPRNKALSPEDCDRIADYLENEHKLVKWQRLYPQ